ncbi:hypothetical protein GGR92_003229 [Spirosoma lacussanchae]|uniref:DUF2846 domain-containing protein n=1 Tax=Spirosoma lacussanchae TaxID=1884249 RepID=UPI00110802D9|nr:DUF2846 domain-containing protein [Spirosoma lacussanchae]
MKTIVIALSLSMAALMATAEIPRPAGAPQAAKVIIFRDGCLYGSMAKYKVIADGQELTRLKNKSIYTTSLAPGMHTISAREGSKRMVQLDVKDGQTYVVQYKTRFGLFGARPKLVVKSVDDAKRDSNYFEKNADMSVTM